MKNAPIETIQGSGNVFRDLGLPNPDLEQLRAVLAADIITVLDDKGLSVRQAQALTGIAAADFSRIRNARLGRFTVDRLMTILHRLGQLVAISVTLQPGTATRPRRRQAAIRRTPTRAALSVTELSESDIAAIGVARIPEDKRHSSGSLR